MREARVEAGRSHREDQGGQRSYPRGLDPDFEQTATKEESIRDPVQTKGSVPE